jgi:hypothetical protein
MLQPQIDTIPAADSPAIAAKINIIGKSNGVGLTRDIALLADSLRSIGHEVAVHAIDTEQARRRRSLLSQSVVGLQHTWHRFKWGRRDAADLNLMLEHVWPEFLSRARRNIVVPNPEWFDSHDLRFLKFIDAVWAKTHQTDKIFQRLGRATQFVGFDSEDRYDPRVRRERRCFHLAGKSMMKGTGRLLDEWARQPHWPTLTVVQHSDSVQGPTVSAANIDLRVGYLDDAELRREQNACMFHLCPSLTEGWGHYIVEALGVGAVPITVDAPPMNELVTAERGLLVPHERTGVQRLAQTHYFSTAGLALAMERAMAMSDGEWARLSANGRGWFEANRRDFPARVQTAVLELLRDK